VPNQIVERSGEIHGVLAGAAADFQHLGAAGKADSQYLEDGVLVAFAGCGEGKHGNLDTWRTGPEYLTSRSNFGYSVAPAGLIQGRFTMSISMYDFSIPVLTRGLTNMSALLDKAAAQAAVKKFDCAVLAQARLFPDMYPLVRQVQIACDTAKGAAARLAGIEVPKHEDTEVTFAELKARIAKTLDVLKSVTAAQLKESESRAIEIKFPNGSWKFTGIAYWNDFVLPNFFFHVSMVYALLRKNGIEIGKGDYLGEIR
jgi:hypothetical protein